MPTAERTTSVTELVAERLYRARTVILSGEINQRLAANVSAQLLALAADSPDPITIYLNSQGGHVESGDTIYVPRQALRDAIFATKDFAGITGTLTCGQYGDCGAPVIAVYQITAREVGGQWPPEKPIWP